MPSVSKKFVTNPTAVLAGVRRSPPWDRRTPGQRRARRARHDGQRDEQMLLGFMARLISLGVTFVYAIRHLAG